MNEGRTLLIVEDDVETRSLYREMFELLRWRIVSTGSGEEALALIRAYNFDAVIADQRLEDFDGAALIARVLDERLIDARKIVVVSGYERSDVLPTDVRFVQKPIEPRKLSIMLGSIAAPVPLITVYICGSGQQSIEVVQFIRDVVRGHDVEIEVIDLMADDPKASSRQVSFSPSFVVRYKHDRWRFTGPIHTTAKPILTCIEYLTERANCAIMGTHASAFTEEVVAPGSDVTLCRRTLGWRTSEHDEHGQEADTRRSRSTR